MSSIKVYNQEGKEVSETKLNEAIFGLPWNADVVHQAVRTAFANKRQILSSTKGRSEVRGGGRKPWRQKGSGRARHGSIRSPLWKGGGVTFGPTSERNFNLKINKKMAKKALLTALSAKFKDGEILVLEDLKLSVPKTKEMAKVISDFSENISVGKRIKSFLIAAPVLSYNLTRAGRNLPNLKIININNLNIFDVMSYQYLVLMKEGVEALDKKYASYK